MATQGLSLHLGLNGVDPVHYQGWDGALSACEMDAKDMKALATSKGFAPTMLLTKQVTSAVVIAAITDAAKKLGTGDIFFITYSGHGGQVPDTNHDEDSNDRKDETWVLYDRQLVDDELYALWSKFKPGVRITVLSDSCHSGTVTRELPPILGGGPAGKALPPVVASKTYKANKALYNSIQQNTPAGESIKVKASVVLISGCQDNQTSLDGTRNGLFTQNLRKVWANGKFTGGYKLFRDKIAVRMPPSQTPNYYTAGSTNAPFEGQSPFTV